MDDGFENPLYEEKNEEQHTVHIVPTNENYSVKSLVFADEINGELRYGKIKRNACVKLQRLLCVIGAIALVLSAMFLIPYGMAKHRHKESTTLSHKEKLNGRIAPALRMPKISVFEAILKSYSHQYEFLPDWLEERLAAWWRAPATQEIVLQATVLDADGIAEIINEFHQFQKKFGRNAENFVERLNNFFANFEEIERLNTLHIGLNTTFAVNQFTDWSDGEFQQMLLPVGSIKEMRAKSSFIRQINPIFAGALTDEYPERFDWRDKGVVTPVKNQGKCGSCWAFATTATVESAYAVAHGELRSLSEQELLDCNMENNACSGGDCDKAFRYVHEHGLMSETAYPYLAQRQNSCRLAMESEKTKIDVAYFINPDEKSMIDWLINFGPVNVGINVPPDMKPYTGGVYRPSDYDCKFRIIGEHALLIVGYGSTAGGEKYWIVKNSWGDTWGIEHGYVNFARGVNACGIEDTPIGLLA